MDNLNFYHFLLPSSLQFYKEEVNNVLVGDQSIDVSGKSENKEYALDTWN